MVLEKVKEVAQLKIVNNLGFYQYFKNNNGESFTIKRIV